MSKEISEKIGITVYGTDSKGEMFVEDTTTTILTREWITLPIRKRITLNADVIVFNKTNGNQAEFQIESQDAAGLYKALLKDLSVDIWERDFGQPEAPAVDDRARVHLVCKSCGTQESVQLDPAQHTKVAEGEILWRHCATCVEETDWQAQSWLAEQRRRDEQRREEQRKQREAEAAQAAVAAAAAAPAREPEPKMPPPEPDPKLPEQVPTPPSPASPLPSPEPMPAPLPAPIPVPEPAMAARINWAEKRTSRRIQMKTRARVRRADKRMEVVSPLNVSRGGICFESKDTYALDEPLMVAMHYREGEEALETQGTIVRVSPREGHTEYGVRFQ